MARETDPELPRLKELPRWARGEWAGVFKKKKKKRGSARVKELKKKQNVSHPGRAEDNAFCGAGEDNQLTRSQAYTRYREGAEQ